MKPKTEILRLLLMVVGLLGGMMLVDDGLTVAKPAPFADELDDVMATTMASSRQAEAPLGASQSFTQTFYVQHDTWIDEANPTTQHGSDQYLRVGRTSLGDDSQTLLWFDVSGLPANAVILDATLAMYIEFNVTQGQSPASPAAGSILVDAVDASWSENTVTWQTRPASTYLGDPASDYQIGWTTWDVQNVVQDWITNGNDGLLLRLADGQTGTNLFHAYGMSNRARLTVNYVTQGSPMILPAQRDTWVNEAVPSTNYGSDVYVYAGEDGTTGDRRYTLLWFDTSNLPDDIVVTSATLEAYSVINLTMGAADPQAVTAADFRPEAILSDWAETSVTWNTRPAVSHQGDPASEYQDGWTTWDVTHIVEGWVSGALVNHGVQLSPGAGTGFYYWFARPAQNLPRLTIAYEPIPCTPVTGASISGPSEGLIDTSYEFSANVTPVDASTPLTYTWEATDHAGTQDTSTGVFSWDTPGTKTVTLTVENCGGTVVTTHTVEIDTPPPVCDAPLTDLTVAGPDLGARDALQIFTATVAPASATHPVTVTWEATDQTPVVQSGDFTATTLDWSWSATGTKQLTVTAENCGGTFTDYHVIEIVETSQLPDLFISGAWYESDVPRVGYIIRNDGGSTAPSGHRTRLYRGLNLLNEATFDQTLIPGAVRAGYVTAAWACASPTGADMRLEADASGLVSERDEANNVFVQSWSCDLKPPEIISGPTVLNTTEHTAVIAWETSEPTSYRVEYGTSAVLGDSVQDVNAGTQHQVTLTGLSHGSTYRYRIFIIDEGGNEANSPERFFETQPLGADPPELTDLYFARYSGYDYEFYTLRAYLVDPEGVERVAFYFDGTLVGTDYTGKTEGAAFSVSFSPHALGLSRDAFFGQAHEIEARATTLLGLTDTMTETVTPKLRVQPLTLTVTEPGADERFYVDDDPVPSGTGLDVTVVAIEYEWACTWTSAPTPAGLDPVRCQDVDKRAPQALHLWVDTDLKASTNPTADAWVQTFDLDLEGMSVGSRNLRVRAQTSDGEMSDHYVGFELVEGEPLLALDRTVTRNGNRLKVNLTLENQGTATASVDYLIDAVQGFQVVHKSTQPGLQAVNDATGYYEVETYWWGDDVTNMPLIKINLMSSGDAVDVAPGESFTMAYELVPILYETLALSQYAIGTAPDLPEGTIIIYRIGSDNAGESLIASGELVTDPGTGALVPLYQAVIDAAGASDYILVTSPPQLELHALDGEGIDGLNDLLSHMAQLAASQDGVLGYVSPTISSGALDDLLESGGLWADSLHPNFRQTSKGYVLFVGEEEILPIQSGGYGVDFSDLRYANTGSAARPELVFGRLVGDTTGILREPLDASISYHRAGLVFDRSDALLVSGRADGEGTFWSDVNDMANRLSGDTDVTKIRWKSHGDPDAPEGEEWRSYFEVLNGAVSEQDVIVFRGHGSADWWSPGLDSNLTGFLNLSPTTRPFVMALACTTGDFKGGDDYSIAEAFLRRGAGVYIGSTETSSRIRNSDAARGFFNRWEPSRSVGDVFHDLQRDKWDDFDWGKQSISWERWVYDYQYFGDPKFGAPRTTVAAAEPVIDPSLRSRRERALRGSLAQTELMISVPDYEVTSTEEGYDYVVFPNADRLAREGHPMVPIWTVTVDYPAGQRVQDVALVSRGGLEIASGLDLPTATFQLDGSLAAPVTAPKRTATAPDDGWYPQTDDGFRWVVSEHPDGTTELTVILYPFLYNPTTTDVRFYRDFTLEVETITTTVALEDLKTTDHTYPQGDPVTLDLTIANPGTAQDVIVRAVVTTLEGREIAGLPLRTLHDLQGQAHLTLDWDSGGVQPDDYVLDVTLLDGEGHTLDRGRESFTLGIVAGEVSYLSAAPGTFVRGDEIALSMEVHNTGTVPITGTAVLHIQESATFSVAAVLTETLAGLAPGSALTLNGTWDTTGAAGPDYRVVGFVEYGGAVSEAEIVALSTKRRIYLPLVTR